MARLTGKRQSQFALNKDVATSVTGVVLQYTPFLYENVDLWIMDSSKLFKEMLTNAASWSINAAVTVS